jgi:hypothetical protein
VKDRLQPNQKSIAVDLPLRPSLAPGASPAGPSLVPRIAAIGLVLWLVMLCTLPDPRPLAAPEWTVRLLGRIARLGEPQARFAATALLRGAGVGFVGVLLAVALSGRRSWPATAAVLAGGPLLALAAKRINFGSLPIWPQLVFIVVVAFLGGLAGLALRRNWVALGGLIVVTTGLAAWGAATRVCDDLYAAWQGTARHLLAAAADVPDGDEGFLQLLQIAFAYAEDNSHGTDAVLPNRAAILALGKLLGDDKVASVGGRDLELGPIEERDRLRQRIRLDGRGDLSKHFWVSAALTVLTDESRALTVGIAKEAMDSTPGGSGFSFVDMAANSAGIRLAAAATRDDAAAHALQSRLREGVDVADILPSIAELPENITGGALQADFGGLGGAETRRLLAEIDRRIAALPLYTP